MSRRALLVRAYGLHRFYMHGLRLGPVALRDLVLLVGVVCCSPGIGPGVDIGLYAGCLYEEH